ncbi:aldehyde dehydrogenase family protein, partial [Vibrio parahaemolyticus]|nr:aldehyde dehydrogenase family protein [Vibrio parahaemolyticus]
MTRLVPLFIGGEFRESQTSDWVEVTNPATNDVIAYVPCSTEHEMEAAIDNAKETFQSWKEVAVSERARVMLRYQHLLKEHHDELATLLSHETGKILADAKGDVWRGIEVVEQAANIASNMMGETVENVATDIDSYSM